MITGNFGTSIPDVDQSQGVEQMGEIHKVVFQRVRTAGILNGIATPLLKASWTPPLTATDGTKVVCSPIIWNPTPAAGAATTIDGPEGIKYNVGREATTFEGELTGQSQTTVISSLKKYQGDDIGVYIVDNHGLIWCLVDNVTTPTKYMPIPIKSLFIGDLTAGTFNTLNKNKISWSYTPDWSDNLVGIKPTDFNPKTDLVKPAK